MERVVLCLDTSQMMFNEQARLADKNSRTLYVSSLDLFISLPSFSDPTNKQKKVCVNLPFGEMWAGGLQLT